MSNYPLVGFHFQVEWGGNRIGFSEVSGLSVEHEIIEYRDGASPDYNTIKMPGMRKYSNIIFKRGAFRGDNDFFSWMNSFSLGHIERRDITIALLNEEHRPIMVWKVKNAWPISLKYAELNAMKSEVLIERLEIAHEGLKTENL
ncbi:phage tail protein [Xanthomarina sp. F2636L]|uniref:phage tail protein n=1 Tax=Xanthomarina sp. F2636L TaxID=2996018 RepID=UPI00225E5825|nr:phage tail protein [Xanthomarina sp. F2636L]MCX7549596.1 phage tail protein [Xanthomarina sp. F2636L]